MKTKTIFTGGKGAIRGTITDAQGAVVAVAKVTATNEKSKVEFYAESNEDGVYIVENLPSGKYTVRVEYTGFAASVVENVPVRSSNLTELDFTLSVGGASTVVDINSEDVVLQTSDGARTNSLSFRQITELPVAGLNPANLVFTLPGVVSGKKSGADKQVAALIEEKSTPKLREYFPETLVWQPEIITDQNGKAEIKFKLGDNITTWKLYAIASDANGKIGIAEREIRAFQPFFVDLDPPKFLTVGDEIFLPVQIRNYTEAKQTVQVSMANGDWFNFLDQANKQVEVAPNNAQNAVFGFRANMPIEAGKQRVTAIADKDSDAIEKPVTVKPNGKEIVQTKSEIFREAVSLDANFPIDALPNTLKTQLKIYPNLLAHVAESIEGLLQRPYGCGEQTISSTYPNLMILRFTPKDGKIYARAENFLQKGYERLLGYQQANGGFSVWTKDESDVALTAYALRFLTDAKDYIEVDETVVKRAQSWLMQQQRADGSWSRQYSWERTEDRQRTKLITTYAARTLAMTEKSAKEKSTDAQKSL